MSEQDTQNDSSVDEVETSTEGQEAVTAVADDTGTEPVPPDAPDNTVKFWFREPSAEAKKKDATLTKRPDLVLTLPFVDQNGLIDAMASDTKVMQYVVDIVNNAIEDEARLQVKRDDKPVMTQEELDVTKLTLEYLADKPSERKSSGISKEDWQEFETSYVSTMPTIQGKDVDKVKKVAKIFVARLVPMKTSKPVLTAIKPMLATWYDSLSDEDKEKYLPIYTYLDKKFEEYLAITDENLLADLI